MNDHTGPARKQPPHPGLPTKLRAQAKSAHVGQGSLTMSMPGLSESELLACKGMQARGYEVHHSKPPKRKASATRDGSDAGRPKYSSNWSMAAK